MYPTHWEPIDFDDVFMRRNHLVVKDHIGTDFGVRESKPPVSVVSMETARDFEGEIYLVADDEVIQLRESFFEQLHNVRELFGVLVGNDKIEDCKLLIAELKELNERLG